MALAERVRLGVHPYEALGLEVEKVAGDWDTVRILRKEYPLAADQQERRVCDGEKVLRAAREGRSRLRIAGRRSPTDLAPLDDVLDTYADLLVADGVHALVTGRADLANAAMEAAAGLGAPPELRAIRTPRAGHHRARERVGAAACCRRRDARNADPGASPIRRTRPRSTTELGRARSTRRRRRQARRDVCGSRRVLGGADGDAPSQRLSGGELRRTAGDRGRGPAHRDRRPISTDASFDVVAPGASGARRRAALDPDDAGSDAADQRAAARWHVDLASLVAGRSDDGRRRRPQSDTRRRRDARTTDSTAPHPSFLQPPGASPHRRIHQRGEAGDPRRWPAGRTCRCCRSWRGRCCRRCARTLTSIATWLEIVAAVRPRLAPLEARQLDPPQTAWAGAVAAPRRLADPWHPSGPVVVAYGPGVDDGAARRRDRGARRVDRLGAESASRDSAAFGFNSPKSRAPQAVLVRSRPTSDTAPRQRGPARRRARDARARAGARAAADGRADACRIATSTALVQRDAPRSFLDGWPP